MLRLNHSTSSMLTVLKFISTPVTTSMDHYMSPMSWFCWSILQPKQNNAVLETFRVSYIGESPYITCFPSLHHHKLSTNDKFLILSSDGLYQYFTNEEAAAKVESFITMFPDRDPAQLLIEEALGRAAKKAGTKHFFLLNYVSTWTERNSQVVKTILVRLIFIVAGMEFHELLDIPQGERRNYHDDISIVIISIEGKIWRV